MAGLAALAIGALAFGLNVGLVAVSVAVVLTLLAPNEQKGAVDKIGWSTILLVGGVITYVGVLQKSGAIDSVGQGVTGMGAPLLAALLLCYIGGVVSAFASSVGVLGAIIPLAVPFLQQGQIGTAGMIAALGQSPRPWWMSRPSRPTGRWWWRIRRRRSGTAVYKKLPDLQHPGGDRRPAAGLADLHRARLDVSRNSLDPPRGGGRHTMKTMRRSGA